MDLAAELETPAEMPSLVQYEVYSNDPITHNLVTEIRAERNLMQRCIDEFYQRRIHVWGVTGWF